MKRNKNPEQTRVQSVATSREVARRDRRQLGAEGEALAAAHLTCRGYRIIARNVRADGVEIDLIAHRGGTVAFVEVKTRRIRRHAASDRYGRPAEAVDARKQARLIRGARAWLQQQQQRPRRARFDVVEVWRDEAGDRWQIEHWPAAFESD